MDLKKESSGGPRILTARHISSAKSQPEPTHAATTNTTLLCEDYSVDPDFQTYLSGLSNYAYIIFPLSIVCVALLVALYVITLKAARTHSKQGVKNIAVVVSVYPIVGLCACMVVVLPRVRVLAEAVAQEAVMVAMYYFYCYIVAECGGKDQLVRKHVSWIGYLVLQLPIIQGLIYLVVLILWAENTELYESTFSYLQPLVVASILTGVWGIVMSVRAGSAGGAGGPVSAGGVSAVLRGRFLAVQLALLVVKLQNGASKLLPKVVQLACPMELHPVVMVNLIQNCIMLLEMLLLSTLAYRLYSMGSRKRVDSVQHVVVAVLDDGREKKDCKL